MIGSVALWRGGLRSPVALFHRFVPALARFGAVGGVGLLVNQGLLWALVSVGDLHYLLAATLATAGSTTFNFIGTEAWVFRGRKGTEALGLITRFAAYAFINSAALVVRLPMLFALTSGLHVHYLLSNVITLAVLTLGRFAIADGLIWSGRRAETAR